MKQENLYLLLEISQVRDLIVTFMDGDSYYRKDLDLCPSLGEEEEPIVAFFSQALHKSKALEIALATKPLKKPGILWTSEPPVEPIGMRYTVEDIKRVFDNENSFYL